MDGTPQTSNPVGVKCEGQCKELRGTRETSAITVECKLDGDGNPKWHKGTELISNDEITVSAKKCPCEELPDVFAWKCRFANNTVLNDDQVKKPALNGRECEGFCLENDAVNSSAIVKYTCVLKDNIPNWETNGAVVTIANIKVAANDAKTSECKKPATCEDIKETDPGNKFDWNCTVEVLKDYQ